MNLAINSTVAAGLVASMVRIATPLLYAGLGGVLCEAAGTFGVCIEGMMLMGAFAGAVIAFITQSYALGLVCSALGGAGVGLLMAIATGRFSTDHMVTGLSINILVAGVTSFLLRALFGGRSPNLHLSVPATWPIPWLAKWPVIGAGLFDQTPLTYAAFVCAALLHVWMRGTQTGLLVQATGENPSAVFAAGARPAAIRARALIAGGAFAGIGGAVLALDQLGTFTDAMTNGRGFIALAAVLIGRWRPLRVMLACLLFGATDAVGLNMQGWGLPVSSYAIQMAPYLIALGVLCCVGRATRMPAALGTALTRR
ncbi:ABC transporter permease [Pararobbsia silviterrae]|uniref:ABC transporter permease n=1 Tax=Pararobbsia silviterrae TaxID=1792498 RepID=A0A494X3R8_9BURK|nr:ABC transporter permease [Pararobbsia silviterrae]RKP44990.1 ABC transporter permease [Pararobbsia silviterrae]